MSDLPPPLPPPAASSRTRWVLLVALLALFLTLHLLKLDQRLWPVLKANLDAWTQAVDAHFLTAFLVFFAVYVAVIGLSIPVSVVFGLAAGALFGRWWGTLVINLASTTGAAVAFLLSRYLLHDVLQRRFGPRLQALNQGVRRDGAYYVLTLRLLPVVPFSLTNLGMGLTPIPLRTFWWASQVGMLPGNFVFVNAGTEVSRVDSPAGLVSPQVLMSLALLAVLPLLLRLALRTIWGRQSPAAAPEPPGSYQ